MTSSFATSSSDTTAVDYVRRARRLRARHAANLPYLHRSLGKLETGYDTAEPVARRATTPAAAPPAAADLGRAAFASAVRECLDGPVLRYSLRKALLKQASRLGVGRFEANLVIAEVQHAARDAPFATRNAPFATRNAPFATRGKVSAGSRHSSWRAALLTGLLVQVLILVTLAWSLR